MRQYADLGPLSGLAELTRRDGRLFSDDEPDGVEVVSRLRAVLGVLPHPAPVEPEVTGSWSRDGVEGTVLRWDVGFGAPSEGWLLRPAGERGPLPGVVALHCHGGVKWYGKEKIADGPHPPEPGVVAARDTLYGGTAYATDLARRGHTVLVPDAFGWGSRRVALEDMPAKVRYVGDLVVADRRAAGQVLDEAAAYDAYAAVHEDAMAKTLGLLGTSWGGVVAREDLLAVDLLAAREDVRPGGVAVVGLSGGGARAALATALSEQVRAAVVIAMMSTLEEVLDGYVHAHTWMMLNPGTGRAGDWPDVAAARRPRPLFVGYAERDRLFSTAGMRAAHERIASLYSAAGARDAYTGVFVDAPHSFLPGLQERAWEFLARS